MAKTTYRLAIGGLDTGGFAHEFTAGDGWSDQFAAEVGQALAAITWPASGNFTMDRLVTADTVDTPLNTSVTPAVFG